MKFKKSPFIPLFQSGNGAIPSLKKRGEGRFLEYYFHKEEY
jgi:hypothetical protein